MYGHFLVLPGELKDVLEASADDFSMLLASAQPPPTCQPISYADVAAMPLQVPRHLQQTDFEYVRRGGCVPPLMSLYTGP